MDNNTFYISLNWANKYENPRLIHILYPVARQIWNQIVHFRKKNSVSDLEMISKAFRTHERNAATHKAHTKTHVSSEWPKRQAHPLFCACTSFHVMVCSTYAYFIISECIVITLFVTFSHICRKLCVCATAHMQQIRWSHIGRVYDANVSLDARFWWVGKPSYGSQVFCFMGGGWVRINWYCAHFCSFWLSEKIEILKFDVPSCCWKMSEHTLHSF